MPRTSAHPQTTEQALFDAIYDQCSLAAYGAARRIYDWSEMHGMSPVWERRGYPSMHARFERGEMELHVWELHVGPNPHWVVSFAWLAKNRVPRSWVEELATDLEKIPEMDKYHARLRESNYQKYPPLWLDEVLADRQTVDLILAALDRFLSRPWDSAAHHESFTV